MGFIYEQCMSLQPRNLQLSLELLTNHKARRCQLGLGKAPSPGPVARSAGGERGGGGWPWEDRAVSTCLSQKSQTAKARSRQEQNLVEEKTMGFWRYTSPPQWQGEVWKMGPPHRRFGKSKSLQTPQHSKESPTNRFCRPCPSNGLDRPDFSGWRQTGLGVT